MASFMPEASRLALRLQIGVDGEGKAIHRTRSLRNLNFSATANNIETVATAIGTLLEFPIVKTQKVDTQMVVS